MELALCAVVLDQLWESGKDALLVDWIGFYASVSKGLVKAAAVLAGSGKSPVNVKIGHLRVGWVVAGAGRLRSL